MGAVRLRSGRDPVIGAGAGSVVPRTSDQAAGAGPYPASVLERRQEQHLTVSLEPLDDWLVVEQGDAETWTRGGLIIPAGADQACCSGIVTAVGSDPAGVELGDKVLFPKDAGYDVRMGSGTVKLLRREHVVARIHD